MMNSFKSVTAQLTLGSLLATGCGTTTIERKLSKPPITAPGTEQAEVDEADVYRVCYNCQERLLAASQDTTALRRNIAETAACAWQVMTDGIDQDCQTALAHQTIELREIDDCVTLSDNMPMIAECLARKANIAQDPEREDDKLLVVSGKCERKKVSTVMEYLKRVCIPTLQKGKGNLKKLTELATKLRQYLADLKKVAKSKSTEKAAQSSRIKDQERTKTEAERTEEKTKRAEELRALERTMNSD